MAQWHDRDHKKKRTKQTYKELKRSTHKISNGGQENAES